MRCLGNQIGASHEEPPRIFFQTFAAGATAGPSTIVEWGHKVAPEMAGLVNGMLAHTLDMDDAHRDSLTKTGGDHARDIRNGGRQQSSTGKQMLAAVVAGRASGRLLGLSPAGLASAFSIAGTQLCGCGLAAFINNP